MAPGFVMEEIAKEISIYVHTSGPVKVRTLAKEFDLRAKDIVSLFRNDPQVEIRKVQWFLGLPLQIVTEEDYIFALKRHV